MSGLVGYGSSDEEDETLPVVPAIISAVQPRPQAPSQQSRESAPVAEANQTKYDQSGRDQSVQDALPSTPAPAPAPASASAPKATNGTSPPPSSTSTQDQLRNLTMPPVPNLDIPSSPPGTSPAAMTAKVDSFLSLKAKGVHFNEKLASSSSLRNPSLLGKLSAFAGLLPEDQYASTLPTDIWDPNGFPNWSYMDELAKAQEIAEKRREEEVRKGIRPGVEFVKASEGEQVSRRTDR